MKRALHLTIISALVAGTLSLPVQAKGKGTSGGINLLQAPGARPASLGEAFTAATNDIAAFGYNPASLKSLDQNQALFLYQKGIADDSFGQIMLGKPSAKGGMGLGIGFYNGGTLDLFDGTTSRTVTAKTDLLVSLGLARTVGSMGIGITGKYISSELAETARASAYAIDMGANMPMTSRLTVGAALQNIGTQLKYAEEGDNLPRIARAGLTYTLLPGARSTTLLVDAPYFLNEQELRPAIGVEIKLGIVALRAGYKSGNDLEEFSIGSGFILGSSMLDYSFGLVDQVDARHRVSLSFKFGASAPMMAEIKEKPKKQEKIVYEMPTAPVAAPEVKTQPFEAKPKAPQKKAAAQSAPAIKLPGLYTVKTGESLEIISKKAYGHGKHWTLIFDANEDIVTDPDVKDLTGQKLWLPKLPVEESNQ